MNIILKENEYAEELIREKQIGKNAFETFRLIARYYLDNGCQEKNVRERLDKFLLRCDPDASLPKWSDLLDKALKNAVRRPAVDIDEINITKSEMEIIDKIKGKQCRRLAFTLLCLSKYWMIVNPKTDYWVKDNGNEIMSMANISTSLRRQSQLYRTLWEAGLIQFSKKVDNTNVRVLFANDEGEVAMTITDFRNLGYQYLKYHGEPYFECENCGITVKYANPKMGRPQKYCKSCAASVAVQQRVNSVMRVRES